MNEEAYIDIWKRRLEEKEKLIEQLRAIKHDTQAHFIVIQYYLESQMYEEALLYLKELREQHEITTNKKEVETGNILIDAIVEDYLSRSNEIRFWCEGRIPEQIGMSATELCVLFSNIMSNAVEACVKVETSSKEINMKIKVEKNHLEIKIANNTAGYVDIALLGTGTTKADEKNHGYGIKNITEVVERYKGNITYESTENRFSVCVHLPMIEQNVKKINFRDEIVVKKDYNEDIK